MTTGFLRSFSVIEHFTLPSGETNERLAFIPQDLMADGADAITNAKDKVFPTTRRAMCYPHVDRAWQKKAVHLGIMPGTELYKKLEEEIQLLQVARSQEEFEAVCLRNHVSILEDGCLPVFLCRILRKRMGPILKALWMVRRVQQTPAEQQQWP